MRKNKGFLLIENIMAIVLIAIITTVVGVYIVQVFNSWIFLSGQKGMAFSNTSALYKIMKEIKTANKNSNIITYNTSQLSFKDGANNTITYNQSGTNLYRNSDLLLNNLKNPGGLTFTYLDLNGGNVSTIDAISTIKCKLAAQSGVNIFIIESASRLRINK